jgi:hypothetical protein
MRHMQIAVWLQAEAEGLRPCCAASQHPVAGPWLGRTKLASRPEHCTDDLFDAAVISYITSFYPCSCCRSCPLLLVLCVT